MSATILSFPNPDESTSDAVALDDLAEQWVIHNHAAAMVAKFSKVQDAARKVIKARLGNAEVGTLSGLPVVTWRRTLRVGVSQRLLKEKFPDILDEVSDITEVRTFRVLEQ